MVFGLLIAVTAVPSVYQCADTHRTALGLGIDSPSRRHDSVYRLCSSVFIGLPWPKNTAGLLDPLGCTFMRDRTSGPRRPFFFLTRFRQHPPLSVRRPLRAAALCRVASHQL